VKELLSALHGLGIVDEPREVSGSYGARLESELKAEALKGLLRIIRRDFDETLKRWSWDLEE